mmetsp:Transcript_15244/g.23752  ORF Transcript_15244/g.23752 Transcript_15244/m.23752 type:complete len:611 (+) Transcript_15244:23-1855(+)
MLTCLDFRRGQPKRKADGVVCEEPRSRGAETVVWSLLTAPRPDSERCMGAEVGLSRAGEKQTAQRSLRAKGGRPRSNHKGTIGRQAELRDRTSTRAIGSAANCLILPVVTLLLLHTAAAQNSTNYSTPVTTTVTTPVETSPAPLTSNETFPSTTSPGTSEDEDGTTSDDDDFQNFGWLTHTLGTASGSNYCYLPRGILFNRISRMVEHDIEADGAVCGYCNAGTSHGIRQLLIAMGSCFTVRLSHLMKVYHNLYIASGEEATQIVAVDCGVTDPRTNLCNLKVLIATMDPLKCEKDFVFFPTTEGIAQLLQAQGLSVSSSKVDSCSYAGHLVDESLQGGWILSIENPTSTDLFWSRAGRNVLFQECDQNSNQAFHRECIGNISSSLEVSCKSAISREQTDLDPGSRRRELNKADSKQTSQSYSSDSLGTKHFQLIREHSLTFDGRGLDGRSEEPEAGISTLRKRVPKAAFDFLGAVAEVIVTEVLEETIDGIFGSDTSSSGSGEGEEAEFVDVQNAYSSPSLGFYSYQYNFANTRCGGNVRTNDDDPNSEPVGPIEPPSPPETPEPEGEKGWWVFPAGWSHLQNIVGMCVLVVIVLVMMCIVARLCSSNR